MTYLKARAIYARWVTVKQFRFRLWKQVRYRTDPSGVELRRVRYANLEVARKKCVEWGNKANARKAARHGDRAAAAQLLLSHRRSRFVFYSPTGGTARTGLEQAAKGHKSHCAATGGDVWLSIRLLQFLVGVCDHASGPILVNCLTNGHHMNGSQHYLGQAADIDKSSVTSTAELNTLGHKHNIVILDEDSAHWHCHTP